MASPQTQPSSTPANPFPAPADTDKPLTLAFCGLGHLGIKMAERMTASFGKQGAPVLIWNRTRSKADDFVKDVVGTDKAKVASIQEIVEKADVVVCNLANDSAVKNVYGLFDEALKKSPRSKNIIFVETSTIFPPFAKELATLLKPHPNTKLLTAPVFGIPPVAQRALLVIPMSGDLESKKVVSHVFVPAMARKVIDLGEELDRAPSFKLIGNSFLGAVGEGLAESFTLADKIGINPNTFLDWIKDVMPAPSTINFGTRMLNDDFDATLGFVIDGAIKDVSHMRALSAAHNCPMPTVDIAYQHLLSARAISLAAGPEERGNWPPHDKLDTTAMLAAVRMNAGLSPFDRTKPLKVAGA